MAIDKVNGNRPESVPSKNAEPYKSGQDKINSIMNEVKHALEPNENEHFMPPIKEPIFTLKKAEQPEGHDTIFINAPINLTTRDTIYIKDIETIQVTEPIYVNETAIDEIPGTLSPKGDQTRNPDY